MTAHCADPGSMMALSALGLRVWLEPNDDPRRTLKCGWRLAALPGDHWAGIDTSVPNRIVGEALNAPGRADCYFEIKNVHLRRADDWAEFPDSVTARGARHLGELSETVGSGARAVLLYVIRRDDCARLRLAADIDPAYEKACEAARAAGVEMLAYGTRINAAGVALWARTPICDRHAGRDGLIVGADRSE